VSAGALLTHRDGIVGGWNSIGTAWTSDELPVDQTKNLGRWDARIRGFVFESQLLSALHFSVDANQRATLWHGTPTGGNPPKTTWSALVTMVRPPEATLRLQLALVNGYADLRADRAREIAAQKAPQYAFWGSVLPLYPARHRRTYELIRLALRLAKSAEMNFKNALVVRRPHEYSPQIQPMIQTPIHGSLPSGHSTEAFIVARVLLELAIAGAVKSSGTTGTAPPSNAARQQLRGLLMRQAARIAVNRTVAGVHFPADSMAGQLLGLALGDYFIQRCTAGGAVATYTFDGTSYGAQQDFTGAELFNPTTGAFIPPPQQGFATQDGAVNAATAPALVWLWNAALDEWV
jgi:membrane-associated phospholipid phosphatase